MGVKSHFLFSLGGYSKQASDEHDLPSDIPFAQTSQLSLPDHVHHLVSLTGDRCHPCPQSRY
jgi:hypothetical protein